MRSELACRSTDVAGLGPDATSSWRALAAMLRTQMSAPRHRDTIVTIFAGGGNGADSLHQVSKRDLYSCCRVWNETFEIRQRPDGDVFADVTIIGGVTESRRLAAPTRLGE